MNGEDEEKKHVVGEIDGRQATQRLYIPVLGGGYWSLDRMIGREL